MIPSILSSSKKQTQRVTKKIVYEDVPQEVIYTSPSKSNTYYNSDARGTDKRSKIDAMDAEFDSLQASLAQVRAQKNTDFYDDHNNNYYKG